MANYIEIVDYVESIDDLLYNTEFNQTIKDLLSDIGWRLPQLSTAEVTAFVGSNPNGTLWYDKDRHELQVKKNGTARDVLTT